MEKVSVIIPIYNEAESIPELFERIFATFTTFKLTYEIIAVNDGSRDASARELADIARVHAQVKVINFRTNAGQTAAIHAGIGYATGDIIIPIDSDLENNPEDVALLLAKMREGYDVVSGWRKNRWKKNWILRKVPSMLANELISKISGTHLHDYGCTLKAYRREVIQDIQLYGEMHRFIPAYAAQAGARVTEVEVSYAPRKYGKSNYGLSRTGRVLLDLLVLRFLYKYKDRPIQFFGSIGFTLFFLGVFAGALAVYLRVVYDLHLVQTPLPTFSALCVIVGVQLVTMGILAEMIMRVYYESQNKRPYIIKEKINF